VTRRAIVTAIIVLAAAALPRLADAQATLPGFKMPSNNIYCMFEPAGLGQPKSDLRCDMVQITSRPPPPPASCPLAWGKYFEIGQDAASGVRICVGDTTRDDSLPVLAYGTGWSHNGFLCLSTMGGLVCANAKGHGFMLSRQVQKLF
jgi:Family of unknown function (DUF6636)